MKIKKILFWLYFTFCIYWIVADVRYALNHPEMTDTQRMMHIEDIIKLK